MEGAVRRSVRSVRKVGGFGTAIDGGVALVFALTFIVVVVAALAQIDIARAFIARGVLQDALDASTLAAARSDSQKSEDIEALGDKFIAVHLGERPGLKLTGSEFLLSGDKVLARATAEVTPYFLDAIMGGGGMKVSAESDVLRGVSQPVELALVLDTTGSMSGAKLSSLKAAAKKMVEGLMESEGHVKVAVIPFGQYVNVGVSRRNAAWMNVPSDYSQTETPSCWTQTTAQTCSYEKYACVKYNDGVPYKSTCSKAVNCTTKSINPPIKHCPAPYTSNFKFYGCVGSPTYPKNVQDSDPYRKYPGFLNLTCGSEMTVLTDKRQKALSAIAALSASGQTYIPSGLAWGFNALSPQAPLEESAAYDKAGPNRKPRKVLVLMTDGANTKTMQSNGRHDGGQGAQANSYTAELCNNIKAEAIEIFTVAFEITDATVQGLMKTCASDAANYFDATNSAALDSAFQTIAAAIRDLRIAR